MSDRTRWQERHRAAPARSAPSAFVAGHVGDFARRAPGSPALDVACGSGRHAALLAEHGFRTVAFDHASLACRRVADEIPRVRVVVADARALPFRDATFALIVQTRFLDRAILPDLFRVLRPGGVVLIETFLVAQHDTTGHPRRDFCLEPGELESLCRAAGRGIGVIECREGRVADGDAAAHLAAIAVCKV
jgi:SAM-dependent methyltransferase